LATEAILNALQSYVGLCGGVNLSTPRDAIIIALCKASLPPYYALHVLTINTAADNRGVLLLEFLAVANHLLLLCYYHVSVYRYLEIMAVFEIFRVI